MLLVAALAIRGLHPRDRLTWVMEVAPVMIVLPVLWSTWRHFPLTNLLYAAIVVHGIVLAIGGLHVRARPFGFDLQAWFGLSRNPYDKIGHFCQGFIPALGSRDPDSRRLRARSAHARLPRRLRRAGDQRDLRAGGVVGGPGDGAGADEFLGTQGDPWDTQSDMFMALIGAITAQLLLSRWHDRQIALAGQGKVAVTTPEKAAWERWCVARERALAAPESWLGLAGLYWLEDGRNHVGADPEAAVVLPHGPPSR